VTEEIHDTSHLDRYLQTRQRVSLLNASWRPMLAGAAGAALVVAAVYVTLPKFSVREVTIDHITMRDVPFDSHVPQDKPFDNYIPRVIARPPIARNPPPPDAPVTPAEKKFTETPDYRTAPYRGRIVKSVDGVMLSFADGKNLQPYRWDVATGTLVPVEGKAFDSDQFIGDIGMCTPEKEHPELENCTALHNGRVIGIQYRQTDAPRRDGARPNARQRTEVAQP
jgi:hypothetical protein